MRPSPSALVAAAALVIAVLPSSPPAVAAPAAVAPVPVSATSVTASAPANTARTKKRKKKPTTPQQRWQPKRDYVIPPGSYFTYPNRGKKAQRQIRDRVLFTIQSTWGGPRDRYGAPLAGNGRVRIVTWSFDDWAIARALVAAQKRGVSVQVIGARKVNRGSGSWRWLRARLGTRIYKKGVPQTNYTWSFARTCRGACRGRFGTPHAKYFLFDQVGVRRARKITVQTSANLTSFAVTGQWNHAQVMHSARVYDDYYSIFRQSRLNYPQAQPYRASTFGPVVDFFFPRYGMAPAYDPVYQTLYPVSCAGARSGSTGRTQIRVNQYAIYGERGEWISKRLRFLWERGCDVAIIYSVASRPVLSILRGKSGRGPIPMRQSVITDGNGTITKYNHSKWLTIVGNWARRPAAYVTLSGSANYANLAAGSDEQMQRIEGRTTAASYLRNFAATWRQKSSHKPGYGVLPQITGRVLPGTALRLPPDVPEDEPSWGRGVFKYMTP